MLFFSNFTLIQALVLLVGVALIIIEMMHPGIGAPGIVGSILIIVGVILSANTSIQAFILICSIILVLSVALYIVVKSTAGGNLSKRIVMSYFQQKDFVHNLGDTEQLLNKEGVTMTILRPSGKVDFKDMIIDAVTEGEFIEAGKMVKVVKIEGYKIIVREIRNI